MSSNVRRPPPTLSPELEAELEGFAVLLRRLNAESGALAGFFDASREVTLARAPGRLDVMGGIADYSGSLVLELPIRDGAFAAAQPADDGIVRLASVAPGSEAAPRELSIPASELGGGFDGARRWFSQSPETAWGAYVGGVLVALALRGCALRGARILVSSSVPEGKGVASSAAISVASLSAASAAFGVRLKETELAFDCQKVENLVAGAPSGVMDPMTTALGEEGKLLELLCQPALVRGHLETPSGARFFGIDSGVRHAISGADYGHVRVAAFMGYRILAEREGFRCTREGDRLVVDDPKYGGYLANVPPEVAKRTLDDLPEQLRGIEFLERYTATTDTVTRVDPDATYPVRSATLHPIFEHERVRAFAEALPHGSGDEVLGLLGWLMEASHASYSACGLGSDGTDLLIELVRAAPPGDGLFGAKITGGGSGGTVAVLASAAALGAIQRIAREYSERTGRKSHVFSGSSPGAAAFGTYRLLPASGPIVRG
jgi:galactokinase